MLVRIMMCGMVIVLLASIGLTDSLSLANEPLPVKPESVPVPALPKPHAAEAESKPIGKVHPPSGVGAVPKPAGVQPLLRSPGKTAFP